MAWAKIFYYGPAIAVSIGGTNFGECAEVKISWTPTGVETMDKSVAQTGGVGTVELKAMKAGSGTLGVLSAMRNTNKTVVVTTYNATYTIADVFIEYGYSAELDDPAKTTTFNIKATKWTTQPDTFVTIADL